ncbi:MAG TPA: nitroreductase family protein [Terriglobales bacterium]|nr:nitroreductase family protein [Terriglobales bacterium]
MTQAESHKKIIEAIHERRSVRSYSPQRLEAATIRSLLDAAVWAPTAVHEEPWAFVIVQDRALLQHLSDRAKKIFSAEADQAHPEQARHLLDMLANPDFNIFYDAGTLIVICARPKGAFVTADCWLAAENLLLAAHSMGLGSCVIGFAVPALNTPEIKADLGIPPECTAVAPIIVGVPSGATPRTTRKEPEILAWKSAG